MQEDNVYPTNGAFYAKDQEEELAIEHDQVLSSAPQIREIIEDLRKTAQALDSVSAIDQSVLTSPDEFMHVVAANQIAKTILDKKVNDLTLKYEAHTE